MQNSRDCNTVAWNPVNPRLFAAGYDHNSMEDSSLIIWDIERKINPYLNRVREEEVNSFSNQFGPSVMNPMNESNRDKFNSFNMNIGRVESSLGPEIVTEYQQAF